MLTAEFYKRYQGKYSMQLTQKQIQLIKSSWRSFRGVNPKIMGDLFYSKLFAENGNLRKMFPKDMEQQYGKLIDMLSIIVTRLDKLDELTNDIEALARRHVDYGVRPGHYKLVGSALLWTLKKGLGNDWTKDVETAWTNCYTVISTTMINAAGYKEKVSD